MATILFEAFTVSLLSLVITGLPVQSQSTSITRNSSKETQVTYLKQTSCPSYYPTYTQSSKNRTVSLPQFGIAIDIPDNYRTMLRNDGSVAILDPTVYELLKCIANGGSAPGGGFSSQLIELIPNPSKLPILELASQYRSGDSITRHRLQGLDGYILANGFSTSYWVEIPGVNGVVVFSDYCDCGAGINENIDIIQSLLSRVTFL